MPPDEASELNERILDAALARAAPAGWDAVHLHEVADDLGMSLAELARQVPDKHALGQLLFDRADRALLACADAPGWRQQPAPHRLEVSLMAWLGALAAHRAQARQILRYTLQLDHLHLQVQGVLRVSRTVQWWREASALTVTGFERECLEASLTALYLSSLALWLRDGSPGHARTRRWLSWHLTLGSWASRASRASRAWIRA
jgi:ubiquinone biosynthesis protein COQ9